MARRRFFWLSWSFSMGPSTLPVWRPQPHPGSPHPRRRAVHAGECLGEFAHERSEFRRQRRTARDQDVVEIALGVIRPHAPDRRLEAPPDAIALDRLADLPGDREAEPRRARRRGTILTAARFGFEDEDGGCASRPFADPQVFRALFQRRHWRGGARSCLRLGHAPPIAAAAASLRQALATLRAPPGHPPAARGGRQALAETMPALAHELARLVGPFHVESPLVPSPGWGNVAAGAAQIGPAGTRAQTAPHS